MNMKRKYDLVAARSAGVIALLKAVELCGSQSELARRIDVEDSTLASWIAGYRGVPLEHVPFIVAAVNDPTVTPITLRPDYFKGWALLMRQLPNPDKRVGGVQPKRGPRQPKETAEPEAATA
jgi:DNA-binding transcriptional regulator YdaS (Cro superfamily)